MTEKTADEVDDLVLRNALEVQSRVDAIRSAPPVVITAERALEMFETYLNARKQRVKADAPAPKVGEAVATWLRGFTNFGPDDTEPEKDALRARAEACRTQMKAIPQKTLEALIARVWNKK